MANLLWGKVFYKNTFAGYLREEPGERVSFTYDSSYLNGEYPSIAHHFPLTDKPFISHGLPPFFDNLISEGWLEQAQSRMLGRRNATRFELLLAFGFDCAGAVSVVDPDPSPISDSGLDLNDAKELAAFSSRASLSGVQPKLAVVFEKGAYRAARIDELSTHIAKFSSGGHIELVENEFLTTLALQSLLPDDRTVSLKIESVLGVDEPALIIERFDRSSNERVHFEEFNQLLGKNASEKYEGSHKEMANFIQTTQGCLPTQTYLLYCRILAGLLLGNTDMHFKNFAMVHTSQGLRLAPNYDQVNALLYHYKTIALTLADAKDLPITKLKSKHLIMLGEEFGLSHAAINMAFASLTNHFEAAKTAIHDSSFGSLELKSKLIQLMEKRWNGTYRSIGKALSKKP